MNPQKEKLIQTHAERANTCLSYWSDPDSLPESFPAEELSYEILLHSGMSYRYGSDEVWPQLKALPFDGRQRLILEACNYASGIGLVEEAKSAAETAMFNEIALQRYQECVCGRDQLDVIINMMNLIGSDVISENPGKAAFDFLCGQADELEKFLEEQAFFTAKCSEPVLSLVDHLDSRKSDWWASRLPEITQQVYGPSPEVMALWRQS